MPVAPSLESYRPARRLLSPLRLRLLGMVAIAFVPVAFLITRLAADERHATQIRARANAMRLLDSTVVEQRDLIRGGRELIGSLALLPEVADSSPAACSRMLTRFLAGFPYYSAATRITLDRRMDCSSVPFADSLADVSRIPSLARAARTGSAVEGYYRVGRYGQPLATVLEPVRDDSGRIRFYFGVDIELRWFDRLATALPRGQGSTLALIDTTGYIYARHPDPEGYAGHRFPSFSVLRPMFGQSAGFVQGTALDGGERLYTFRALPGANESRVFLVISTPPAIVYADANRHLRDNLTVAAVTLLVALMMAWIAADLFVIRDVGALLRATARLAEGDLSTRVPMPRGGGELNDLAERFNLLARRLEERRREFVVLGDSSPDAIVRIDRDLKVDWANATVVNNLRLSLDDLVGRSITEVPVDSPVAPVIIEYVKEALATGRRHESEEQVRATRGEVWLDLRLVPERNAAGEVTHVMLIARDVTARKHLATHLAQAERLDSIGKLAGSIAHDFNNLLTAIIGNAEIAVRSLEPGHRVRADITEILDVARRASSLTRQLLSFARRQPTAPRVIDVNPFIEEASVLLRRLMGASITLDLRLHPAAPRIRFDPTHFEQVLVNLATNARDAMPSGGTLTISTASATVSPEGPRAPDSPVPGEYLLLGISDTGVGMSPTVRHRVFEPFFTTKRDQEGTGLGLAVTYGLVRQQGGYIDVDSLEGRGTTFRIYFPATHDAAEPPPRVRESAPPAPTGRETILLVEDQDHVRTTIARQLRSHGYSVVEARDGVDVLQRRDRNDLPPFHLIITDLVMPRMGGEALVAALRHDYPQAPVLLISGFDERGSARDMLARGEAGALLEKPFEAQPLLRLVRELLDRAPASTGIP
jgi:PAS domain S-box-containing protein